MILSIVICLALGALSVFGVAQGVEEHTQKVQAAQGVETDAPSSLAPAESQASTGQTDTTQPSYIKWVEFNAPYTALSDTLALDIKTHEEGKGPHVSWIDSLAWLACKNGGNWKGYKSAQLQKLKDALADGKTVDELMADNKYYDYYKRAYTAVLGGMVGEYEKEAPDKEHEGQKIIVKKYGLKAYCRSRRALATAIMTISAIPAPTATAGGISAMTCSARSATPDCRCGGWGRRGLRLESVWRLAAGHPQL